MKKQICIVIQWFVLISIFATGNEVGYDTIRKSYNDTVIIRMFNVTGVAFLSSNSNINDTSVSIKFKQITPIYRDYVGNSSADGSFSVVLDEGIHNVIYSHKGYDSIVFKDVHIYDNLCLDTVILKKHKTLYYVPSEYDTISKAVALTYPGDTIILEPHTYEYKLKTKSGLIGTNLQYRDLLIASKYILTGDTSYIGKTIITEGLDIDDSKIELVGINFNGGFSGDMSSKTTHKKCISIQNGELKIKKCLIQNYKGGMVGNGIDATNSEVFLDDVVMKNICTELEYKGPAPGTAIGIYNSNLYLNKVVISRCIGYTGTIFLSSGSITMTNTLICNNANSIVFPEKQLNGGSAVYGGGKLKIINCTIANNKGAPIYYFVNDTIIIKNSIFYKNTGDQMQLFERGNPILPYARGETDSLKIINNNFWSPGCKISNNTSLNIGLLVNKNINDDSCDIYQNILADPDFEDTINYELRPGSPCINAGDTLMRDEDGSVSDMGWRPYNLLNPYADFNFEIDSSSLKTVKFFDRSTESSSGNDIVSWMWQFGDATSSNEQNPKHTYSLMGLYDVILSVQDINGNKDIKKIKLEVGEKYTVSFNTMGGITLRDTIVEKNSHLDCPVISREGFTFKGWFKEETLSHLWDEVNDSVKGNMTLYAGWEINSSIADKTVNKLQLFPNPTNDMIELKGVAIQQVSICNLKGEIVLQTDAKGDDNLIIDVAKLLPDLYIVIVETMDKQIIKVKFLKKSGQ